MLQLQQSVTDRQWKTVKEMQTGINYNLMAKEFRDAFTKGTWGRKDIPIVESLKRDGKLAVISQIRRITTPTNRRTKLRDKRMVNLSQFNVICPETTPEGEACGLVKDPAISIYISQERESAPILSRLQGQFGSVPTTGSLTPLFLNGVHLGFCDGKSVYDHLINLRRNRQQVYFDTAIILNEYNELWVETTGGRIVVPYLVVDPDSQELEIDRKNLRGSTIDVLLDDGALEYIDSAEQEQIHLLIAKTVQDLIDFRQDIAAAREGLREAQQTSETSEDLTNAQTAVDNITKLMRFTHSIIDPQSLLGAAASTMPFPGHNPAPRVAFQAGMAKQALGSNSSRVELRFDTNTRTMVMPDVPVVATDMHEQLGLDKYPTGATAIVAIMTRAQNQEDAISMNKASVERGMFKMAIYHSYKAVIKQSKDTLRVVRVPKHAESQKSRYSKLDPKTGIVKVGEYVYPDDCLIGIEIVNNDRNVGEPRNGSIFVEINKEGRVEEVFETHNAESLRMIQIRIRETRDPELERQIRFEILSEGCSGRAC